MSLHLALGQFRAHFGRYVATMVAITLSVAFVLASAGLMQTVTASVDSMFGGRYEHTDVLIENVGDRSSASDDEERAAVSDAARQAIDIINTTAGVRAVTTDSTTYVRVKPEGLAQHFTTATALASDEQLRWQPLAQGRLPQGVGEVAVRADGDVRLGQVVDVQPSGTDAPVPVTVVGVLDLAGQPDLKSGFPLYTVDEQVQLWAASSGGAGGPIRVAGDGTVPADRLAVELRDRLAVVPGSDSFSFTTGQAASKELTEEFVGDRQIYTNTLVAFTVLAVAVAALVIASTFAVVFAARIREMALLRCLGATKAQVRLTALAESLLLAVVSTAIGLFVGAIAVEFIAGNAYRLGVTLPLHQVSIPDSAWVLAAAVGVAVTVATALIPILRATSGSPLLALRPADVRPEPWWRQVLMLVAGAAVMALAWWQLDTVVAARDVVAAGAWGVVFFLGAVVAIAGALPTLLGLIGSIVGVVLGPLVLLGARNIARSPRRTASTASAILVGVTLTATMVTGIALLGPSIQARFVDKIPLDMAITAPDGLMPPELEQRLRDDLATTEVVRVTDMYATDSQGRRTVLRVVDPQALTAVMRRDVTVPADGEIVLPHDSTVAAGVADGQRATFTFFGEDDRRELTVRRTTDRWALATPASVPPWPVAQLPDGSPWPEGTEVPSEFIPRSELWVRIDANLTGGDLDAALTRVRTVVSETSPALAVTEAFRSREQVRGTIDNILTASSLLLAIAVIIAVVGVVNTLSLSVAERRRELALLRGVGVTRGGLGLMICCEAVLIGVSAAALGVALGYVLGALGAQALVGADSMTVGTVSLELLLSVGAGGALAAVVAAAITAIPASRTSPIT